MNLTDFGTPKGVQSWSQAKKYHFGPVSSTILAVLKRMENLAYVFIPKRETNITSNYQKGKSNKMSYIISWFVMEMFFNAKTNFMEKKKWEFAYFSLLAYFL